MEIGSKVQVKDVGKLVEELGSARIKSFGFDPPSVMVGTVIANQQNLMVNIPDQDPEIVHNALLVELDHDKNHYYAFLESELETL